MGGQSANIGRINATSRHSWSSYTAPHTDQTTSGVRRTSQNWRIARPEGKIRCRTAWIQFDQGEGAFSGRAIKWSVGCEAQQGPRCRRCLSGRVTCATVCHSVPHHQPISARLTTDRTCIWILQNMKAKQQTQRHQRRKNLGSRVALLPGKFLRVRKGFARVTEKTF